MSEKSKPQELTEIPVLREVVVPCTTLKPGDIFRHPDSGYMILENDGETATRLMILRVHPMAKIESVGDSNGKLSNANSGNSSLQSRNPQTKN